MLKFGYKCLWSSHHCSRSSSCGIKSSSMNRYTSIIALDVAVPCGFTDAVAVLNEPHIENALSACLTGGFSPIRTSAFSFSAIIVFITSLALLFATSKFRWSEKANFLKLSYRKCVAIFETGQSSIDAVYYCLNWWTRYLFLQFFIHIFQSLTIGITSDPVVYFSPFILFVSCSSDFKTKQRSFTSFHSSATKSSYQWRQ